jgi:hypothetical protein
MLPAQNEQQRLKPWQVWRMKRWREEAIANLAALAKGDIVVKFRARKDDPRDVVMWKQSDVGRLNRWLDELNEQLEGYD